VQGERQTDPSSGSRCSLHPQQGRLPYGAIRQAVSTASPKLRLIWTAPTPLPSLTEAKASLPHPEFLASRIPRPSTPTPLPPSSVEVENRQIPIIIQVRVGGDVQTPIAGWDVARLPHPRIPQASHTCILLTFPLAHTHIPPPPPSGEGGV
jgi:hypothetical protein